jgi:hypothetical protein
MVEEPFVPFETSREKAPPVTECRSTWLASSIKSLAVHGLLERYTAALPDDQRSAVLGVIAGAWLPVSVALVHYGACDAMGLPADQQIAIGRDVIDAVHRSTLQIALRLVRETGATPWSTFSAQKRLWARTWRGGDVAVFKLGPKEARVEIVGWPCARFGYCRRATHGVILGQTELFCRKAHVQEIKALCTPTSVGYRVAWV